MFLNDVFDMSYQIHVESDTNRKILCPLPYNFITNLSIHSQKTLFTFDALTSLKVTFIRKVTSFTTSVDVQYVCCECAFSQYNANANN